MERPASILLVEDRASDARLIAEMIRDSVLGPACRLDHCQRLADAVARLRQDEYHACLLDLGLPDSQGLDALVTIRAAAPRVAVIVLTALDDTLALRALQAGAQDYLPKADLTADGLARSLRYSVERQVLLDRLDRRRRSERRAVEERLLHTLAEQAPGPVSARILDRGRLSEHSPIVFSELVDRYAALFDDTVDLAAHGTHRQTELTIIADHLAAFRADAADAVEIHQAALVRLERLGTTTSDTEAAASQLLIELLGLLANAYRTTIWEEWATPGFVDH